MKARKKLTKKQIIELKELILGQVNEKRENEVNSSSEDYQLKSEDRHDPVDEASATMSNQSLLRMKTRDAYYIKKAMSALKRIEDGSFGQCEECDDPIGYERLRARPVAEKCISCKEESEKIERSSVRQSKSLGRSFAPLMV